MRTDQETLHAYTAGAAEIAAAHENADRSYIQRRLIEVFPPGSSVLEIGCGSGADAAMLFANGREITPIDPSDAMLQICRERHPEIARFIRKGSLPGPLPFASDSFDGVSAVTVLMHVPPEYLDESCAEIARVLKPNGYCYLVVFDSRDDLDSEFRDRAGRLQRIYSRSVLVPAMENRSLHLIRTEIFPDPLNRSGVVPREYLFRLIS